MLNIFSLHRFSIDHTKNNLKQKQTKIEQLYHLYDMQYKLFL